MNTHHTTQAEIAKRLGISQPYLSRLLSGKSRPSLRVAEILAAEKGVHVLNILDPSKYGPDGLMVHSHPHQEAQQ